MDKIAVLIPCYNESNTIRKVITDFRKNLPQAKIYVYDNNSTDGTAQISVNFGGIIVRHEYNQGKGNVVRRMFEEIDAECYVLVDGDDTYPADIVNSMIDKVLNHNADMVVGDRLSSTYYNENRRVFHNFGNALVCFCVNKLFAGNIQDIMTGYRALSFRFVKTFPVLTCGFEIETEMSIHALYRRMQVENVVINYRNRPEGSISKLNTYSDGIKVLSIIIKLFKDYKPMGFFGTLAMILTIFSFLLFIPVGTEYLRIGEVPRFPTLIVSCFLMIAALLLIAVGLILSSQLSKDSRDFEFRLNEVRHWKPKEDL